MECLSLRCWRNCFNLRALIFFRMCSKAILETPTPKRESCHVTKLTLPQTEILGERLLDPAKNFCIDGRCSSARFVFKNCWKRPRPASIFQFRRCYFFCECLRAFEEQGMTSSVSSIAFPEYGSTATIGEGLTPFHAISVRRVYLLTTPTANRQISLGTRTILATRSLRTGRNANILDVEDWKNVAIFSRFWSCPMVGANFTFFAGPFFLHHKTCSSTLPLGLAPQLQSSQIRWG